MTRCAAANGKFRRGRRRCASAASAAGAVATTAPRPQGGRRHGEGERRQRRARRPCVGGRAGKLRQRRLPAPVAGAGACRRGAVPDGVAGGAGQQLDHAHHCRPRHGHDDLCHRQWVDPGVRPHGCSQFRPRRLHCCRRLSRHVHADTVGELDRKSLAGAQPAGTCAGHAGRNAGHRRARPGVSSASSSCLSTAST